MKILLKSPLNITQCIENIREVRKMQQSSVFLYHHIFPITTSDIQNNRICLGYKSGGRNSFSPVFLGKFTTTNNDQTELSGELVIHPFVKAFWVIWMSFASFTTSLLLTARYKDSIAEQTSSQIGTSSTVLLFPIVGVLILLVGYVMGKSDGIAIIKLLKKSLKVTNVEKIPSSRYSIWSNLISAVAILISIFSGSILGYSSSFQLREKSAEAELTSFYTCSNPAEKECVPTSFFDEKPNEIYACGYLQTSSRSSVSIYWYREPVNTPIYYTTDIWLTQGFFCNKLDVAEYETGNYTVKGVQSRKTLGQYDFVIK